MRYLFWIVVGALFSFAITSNTGVAVGPGRETGAVAYGALTGFGLAVATATNISWTLARRLGLTAMWLIIVAGMYCVAFCGSGALSTKELVFWGLLFSIPGPLIFISRGIERRIRSST